MASASFRSVAELFLHRVRSTPDTRAFTFPAGGAWRHLTWEQVGEQSRDIACGLLALGLAPEERCAILCSTRVEWILADMGILLAGGATTTVHTDGTAEECAWVLADSGSVVVFTENAEHTARLHGLRARLPAVRRIVQIDPGGEASHDLDPAQPGPWVVTLQALCEAGRRQAAADPGGWLRRAESVEPHHLATLFYTSGTTDRPKGVELTHDCWVFEGEAMDALGFISPADTQYLFLPLAHSFAKVLELATIRIGIHTVVDGRREALAENLRQVRPTFLAAVPRVLEKLYERITRRVRAGGLRGAALGRALATSARVSHLEQQGRRPGRALQLRHGLAERLVLARIQAELGGRLRFVISGGAPLSAELAQALHAAGVLVLEGYGLTESSAASFVNRPERFRFGTVGLPMPGVDLRLDPVDGEILLRSRGLMRGYHHRPEETAAVLTEDGWLRTGDIGSVDPDGFLRITDRKKDLIKTSTGKYVAPQGIESRLRALSPWISHAVVHGDRRAYVTALLTLDEAHARRWAREHGRDPLDLAALSRLPEVQAAVQGDVDRLNATLAPHEQIKHHAILPRDLSVAEGELTPTLKVRRKVVEQRYRTLLDGFYPRP